MAASLAPVLPPSLTGSSARPPLVDAPRPLPVVPLAAPITSVTAETEEGKKGGALNAASGHKRMVQCAELSHLAYVIFKYLQDSGDHGLSDGLRSMDGASSSIVSGLTPHLVEAGLEIQSFAHIYGKKGVLPIDGESESGAGNGTSAAVDSASTTNDRGWLGFMAVESAVPTQAVSGRSLVVAWRGTKVFPDWMSNLDLLQVYWPPEKEPSDDDCVRVHKGFARLYSEEIGLLSRGHNGSKSTSPRVLLFRYLKDMLTKHPDISSITFSGHSLGGAMAILSAFDVADFGGNVRPSDGVRLPIHVFTYGAPRVGNKHFRDRMKSLDIHCIRTQNMSDIVPKVPGLFGPDGLGGFKLLQTISGMLDPLAKAYFHPGEKLGVDSGHRTAVLAHKIVNYIAALRALPVEAPKVNGSVIPRVWEGITGAIATKF